MPTRNAIVKKNNKTNYIKINNNKTNDKINNNKTNNKIDISNNINNNKFGESYLDKIDEFSKIYLINNNSILNNPKIEFRYFCYKYIDYIQNIKLSEVPIESIYEAVLIEFRIFPHLEFIIRNNINKLGNEWSYTIVCGILNHKFMLELCSSISKNIKVIKLDYDNVLPSTYSTIFSSLKFWNLFKGDKILIHQEDSIIFKDNIKYFIDWDYIGAPWDKKQNDNLNHVGNGGFSLRTRQCMIDVINKISIMDTKYNSSTLEYMKNSNNTVPPEDVYFSKNMIDFNIGKVADWTTAFNFSTESFYNPECFGGHAFWTNNKDWKKPLNKNVLIQVKRSCRYKSEHRGGWNSIINSFIQKNIINDNAELLFFDLIEEYFIWSKNDLIENQWCGIIHLTPNTPKELDVCNLNNLLTNNIFIQSLKNCKFIITLCDYIKDYLIQKFNELNLKVPVITIKHPIDFENVIPFDIQLYIDNPEKKLIQIGQQLRKVSSIYEVNITNHDKLWLTGLSNLEKCESMLNTEYKRNNKKINKDYKKLFTYVKDFNEYDELLEKNIAFIDLYDSAANNTVLECIVRNTPLIVNRTQGVVEYLGEDYPLYFNNLDEVDSLLDLEKLKSGHEYLKNMYKEDITMEHFFDKFIKVLYMYN